MAYHTWLRLAYNGTHQVFCLSWYYVGIQDLRHKVHNIQFGGSNTNGGLEIVLWTAGLQDTKQRKKELANFV